MELSASLTSNVNRLFRRMQIEPRSRERYRQRPVSQVPKFPNRLDTHSFSGKIETNLTGTFVNERPFGVVLKKLATGFCLAHLYDS
jgi:hypothetical protein